jgi:signal transduction histidine kinase
MAIELHDNINAKIAAAKWILETINTPDKSQEEQLVINRLVDAMSDIYEDVRFISHNLVPKDIEANTLNELIGQFLQNLSQNQKIKFTFIPAQREPEIGNALKIQAYAMIMELINNIIRHSECQKASVQIHFDDGVMDIRVEDDGKGFVADINQSGTGLKNLTSRVKSVNGSLKISNGLKHGVTVHISIPLGSNGTEQSSE